MFTKHVTGNLIFKRGIVTYSIDPQTVAGYVYVGSFRLPVSMPLTKSALT